MPKKFDDEMYEKHFRVAIFGSARIKKNDVHYKRIVDLAKRIGSEGIDIVTGGGPGLMEAANKGHHRGRKSKTVHSLGLTIELPKEQDSNRHLDMKKDFRKFSNRLDHFMVLSNVVIVAPGGVGTLLEFFYTWQQTQVQKICSIPIILYGEMWPSLISWLKKWPVKNRLINPSDLSNVFVAKTCEDVMRIVLDAHSHYKNDGEDFCMNSDKYKL